MKHLKQVFEISCGDVDSLVIFVIAACHPQLVFILVNFSVDHVNQISQFRDVGILLII